MAMNIYELLHLYSCTAHICVMTHLGWYTQLKLPKPEQSKQLKTKPLKHNKNN